MKQILDSGEAIFRDTDLAVIWGISNKNTLYTTIKKICATQTFKQG